MTATFLDRATDFLTLSTERQFVAAARVTPVPGCGACLAPSNPNAYVSDLNVCQKCAKSAEYLRAALTTPGALRKLADELEDALTERHESTAIARLARVVDALAEQIEAVVELVDGMAGRQAGKLPRNYPTGGFGLFSRGVWKAPWMGRNGEMVLVAINAARRAIRPPTVLPRGADHVAIADRLWQALERTEAKEA